MVLPEEIKKREELDGVNKKMEKEKQQLEEMEMFKKILEGQRIFKELSKVNKNVKPQITAPIIKDGKITFTVSFPLSWIKGYTGDWDKDGVDK